MTHPTDPFEGHTPGPWRVAVRFRSETPHVVDMGHTGDTFCVLHSDSLTVTEMHATAALIAAAPSLLAEVKRLREALTEFVETTDAAGDDFDDLRLDYINVQVDRDLLARARAALTPVKP